MSLRLAELGCQECLDEIPGDGRPHGPAAHAKDVHVIVLDPLLGREVIVDQRGADALNLVGAHLRSHAADADRQSTLHLQGSYAPRERYYIIGIVVALAQAMSAEIDDLMPRCAKLRNQVLLQTKSTVIGANSNAHTFS